jgi:hypothetical protein
MEGPVEFSDDLVRGCRKRTDHTCRCLKQWILRLPSLANQNQQTIHVCNKPLGLGKTTALKNPLAHAGYLRQKISST